MAELKYKVGDRVKIQSLERYNKYKNRYGDINYGCETEILFTSEMSSFCGQVATITRVRYIGGVRFYHLAEDKEVHLWVDGMFECLVERNGKTYPYKIGDRVVLKGNNRCATITDLKYNSWGNLSYYIKIDNDKDISVDYPTDLLLPYDNKVEGLVEEESKNTDDINRESYIKAEDNKYFQEYMNSLCKEHDEMIEGLMKDGTIIDYVKESNDRYRIVIDPRFDIEIDEGEYYAVRRKKEYPKTFEECVSVLMSEGGNRMSLEQMNTFRKLIDARNAYWKIYGEENGLGKPWEPSDSDYITGRYCIFVHKGNIICDTPAQDCVLTFPTEEMRDAFYENFKEEIESCKEFL